MKRSELQKKLIRLFSGLRKQGLVLGIPDLLHALSMLDADERDLVTDSWRNNLELLWRGGDRLPPPDELKAVWTSWFEEFAMELPVEEIANAEVDVTTVLVAMTPTTESLSDNPIDSSQSSSGPELIPTTESYDEGEKVISPEVEPSNQEPVQANEPQYRPREEGVVRNGRRLRRRYGELGKAPSILRVRSDTPAPLPSISGIPIVVPTGPESRSTIDDVFSYAPISRLSMAYAWRYLRRPVTDGPLDVLDVQSTIKLVAHQGFFLMPVYMRRKTNYAHLVLLLDQSSSMMPFRSITHDVVETARQETSIREVNVFYFHNIVTDIVYTDKYLMDCVEFDRALENCDVHTSVLIISDGGSARGYTDPKRVELTRKMLAVLKLRTPLVTWLNPMPKARWEGSSAEAISKLSQMFQMNPDDFSSAIDSLQGRGAAF